MSIIFSKQMSNVFTYLFTPIYKKNYLLFCKLGLKHACSYKNMVKKMKVKKNSAQFIFIFLGMLTAFGPFVTDMYLPSLPSMQTYFNCSVSMVQMGLTFSMLGLAFGQLIFGPLSDKCGRRNPLIVSMILFVFSTLLCIFSPTIEIFVSLRFLQGIAASGGIVISRSIATDKFKTKNLAKALAIIGAINGIAPIAAPVLGGMMLKALGWQGIFEILLVIGLALLGCCFYFQESLSTQRRSSAKFNQIFSNFKKVLKNKKYLYFTLEQSFALAILFAYIASSPFIIQNHYGYSALAFSLFFGANAISIGIGAAFSAKMASMQKALQVSVWGINLCAWGLMFALPLDASIVIFEGLLLILCFMLGMSFTVATTTAMDAARAQAGTASALLGALGFLFGSIVSPLVGVGNIMIATGLVLVVCAALTAFSACKGLAFLK